MENPSTPKQEFIEHLKSSHSILITIPKSPRVEDVASAIGLARILRTSGKKVSTVISSKLPGELVFLNPDKEISTSLDGIRDFVIEFDKSKADKLRYRAEDSVVKVFITPYGSQLSEKDLRFSQGEFNIDTVVVISASTRDSLDEAVANNPTILKSPKVVSITAGDKESSLGLINWHEQNASSVAEMLVSIGDALGSQLNKDSADALLSAIVAATDGFKNSKTTPKVLTIAAQLMASGADQPTIMSHFGGHSSAITQPHNARMTISENPKVKEERLDFNQIVSDTEGHMTITPSSRKSNEEKSVAPDDKSIKSEPLLPHQSDNAPHIDTHPEVPVLHPAIEAKPRQTNEPDPMPAKSKEVEESKSTKDIPDPKPQVADNSELDAARKAVEQAMGVAPVSAPVNQTTSSGLINVDANGNIITQ